MLPMWMQNFIALALIGAALWLYLMPVIEAHRVHHQDRKAITMLAVLGGWTFAGWLAAMIWAHTLRRD